jgi:bifunctional DNA-binding transcriptional regulator/antitoxin component of YhaV-PrlF toxin-antitoxin module
MSSSRLDHRGRTTIPAEVRRRARLQPGARINWTVTANGTVLVQELPAQDKAPREGALLNE